MIANFLRDNLKNIPGWTTGRKLVAFAVDDYCHVRVSSRSALETLRRAGLDVSASFDHLDAMETSQDLQALFEVLESVSDVHGNNAVFTAYALSANPDFDRILAGGQKYCYESVTRSFERLASEQPSAYEGAWQLWKEGIQRGLIRPQFHGREHLNVRLFERKLNSDSADLAENLQCRSLAGLSGDPSMPKIGFSQAFAVSDVECLVHHSEIIRDGMRLFAESFGFRPTTFTPPAQTISPDLYPLCQEIGLRLIHKPRSAVRMLTNGSSVHERNWTGKVDASGHVSLVRNVVFEPGMNDIRASEERVIQQIKAAFRWRKPAIVSSHRVNFCGHIVESNRTVSLAKLERLLKRIVLEWPEVEFISVDELVPLMNASAGS